CKAAVEWNDHSPYRPFCSERCKQIDFGDWATERFSIAGEPSLDSIQLEDEV
ncbi:MAG: DNA gyrase inhibitor YacG, partial [Porticoccaceae bacterium]|nr:DNA gyrase inhibitor YacG [Porticoccaceae bacterium]